MLIIFCYNTLNNKRVDSDYLVEYNTAKELGLETGLIDFEELVTNKNAKLATAKVPSMDYMKQAVYRGWMLRPEHYESLYNTLLAKNIQLINSPEEYKHCHHFCNSYDLIKDHTPKSVYASKEELGAQLENISYYTSIFGDNAIIVKDYVKSRKHEWFEACYIPKASDTQHVVKVVRKLIDLQGDQFNGGIVFREFVKLEHLTMHDQSGMPLSKEFRIFFIHGEPTYTTKYWDEGDYEDIKPNMENFLDVARTVRSKFFTMDIAKTVGGSWVIIELGDGQVAGLPDSAVLADFYTKLKNKLT